MVWAWRRLEERSGGGWELGPCERVGGRQQCWARGGAGTPLDGQGAAAGSAGVTGAHAAKKRCGWDWMARAQRCSGLWPE
ncbi:hypothetical protein NDU88_004249 [Pleurodeles waltl]|uniref:Uncharacterized protein n=1 Tax=Pleurodeles waltl TaxID=8319 RepID=A0AAV7MSY4_PLEWA|nr:hypothetical protein NDU88_004249 [Pleurodeles waltl]